LELGLFFEVIFSTLAIVNAIAKLRSCPEAQQLRACPEASGKTPPLSIFSAKI
jgi:hypothetical protein|tara:strand:- start:4 stop:162 length:159 start_codon:yes stop_codon:yes gene_type:complete